MEKNIVTKIEPRTLQIVALLVAMVASIFMLIANRGFYFTNYQQSYLLATTDNVNLDQFTGNPQVASIDREGQVVIIQNSTPAELEKLISDIGEQNVTVTDQKTLLPLDLSTRIVLSTCLAILVTLLFSYFTVLRYIAKQRYSLAWQTLGLYTISVLSALLIQAGLLSIVSRLYTLTEMSFSSLILVYAWGVSLSYMAVHRLIDTEDFITNTNQIVTFCGEIIKEKIKNVTWVWVIILLGAVIGLGTKFAIDAILIGAGIWITGHTLILVPQIILDLVEQYKGRASSPKTELETKPEKPMEEAKPKATSQKKSRKSKKKKQKKK